MTIAGSHSLEEASQYFDALDYRVKAIDKLIAETDTSADATLKDDWAVFWKRWDAMATKVRLRMGYLMATNSLFLLSSSARALQPDDADYRVIQTAWSPTYPLFTDTDGSGLQIRVEKITGPQGKGVDLTNQPKQNSLDVDLKLYQASDSAIKGGQTAIKEGQTAASNFAQDNWGKGLLIGAAAVGGLILYKKI
jgi:hypothetical protein